jgi:hypothetical protein
MIVKKLLLIASAAALMSTPAWAGHGRPSSNQGNDHPTPNDTGNLGKHHGEKGGGQEGNQNSQKPNHPNKPSHPGQSHKCKPHSVAYVASGTLVSQTLTKSPNGRYSGVVTIKVMHTNHHAAADNGTTKPYMVENVKIVFALADTNKDGSVGLDDLKEGDRAKLIGKITTLAKSCNQGGFTATTTIRQIVFHAP